MSFMSLTTTDVGSHFTLQPGGRLIPFVVVLVAFMTAWPTTSTPVFAQQTFQVDSRGDAGDANVGDGSCETAGGVCTLRAAIEEANADGADDTIEFGNIPTTGGFAVISPSSEFQVIETVTIDGTTAPNWSSPGPPVVVLDGNGISGTSEDGIDIRSAAASETSVSALAVNNFPDDGINILFDAADVTVTYCYVGIDVNGTTAAGNGDNGVEISADDAFIGARVVSSPLGSTVAGRNVISGNEGDGIFVNASNTIISQNYIGTTSSGEAELGNGENGVRVDSGTGNEIGFVSSSFLNTFYLGSVISGNTENGIILSGGTATVLGNNIGTSADGQSDLPNDTGIAVESNGHTIGPASDTPARNIISGNQFNGVRLGEGGGASADNNVVQYNYIGVSSDASTAIPNGNGSVEAGVRVDQGSGNGIANNVIAGNNAHGIFMRGDSFSNEIRANFIGTNRTFDDLGNNFDGIRLVTSPSSNLSETEVYDQNVIGHNRYGVYVEGDYHDVTNNFIGTNDNGANLGNSSIGVYVRSTNNNVYVGRSTVGGTTQPGNIIGFNGGDGILLSAANNSVVLGNYVGTNDNGTDLGNGRSGINIAATSSGSASENQIGYTYGESLPSDPSANAGNDGNVIAFNGDTGIDIGGSGTAVNNNIRGNSIYQNGADNMTDIGIDLNRDGTTANDNGNDDADSGPNNLQNFPVINSVNYNTSSGEVTIDYTVFTASGNADYGSNGLKVDFYAADSEQGGEGKTYLDTQFYNTPSSSKQKVIDLGNFSNVDNSDFFVATVTDASGNTSEFIGTSRQLPVELAGFKAQPNSENVVLTWRTLSEKNNDRFIIQHQGPESKTFARLGDVDGQGSTSETTRYRFETEALPAGTHTFRLKQVDLDGTPHLSDEVTARIQMQADLTLEAPAPNPVRDQISVSFGVREAQPVQLALYDLLGRKVSTLYDGTPTPGQTQTIERSVRDLPSGRYFVRLEGGANPIVQSFTVIR